MSSAQNGKRQRQRFLHSAWLLPHFLLHLSGPVLYYPIMERIAGSPRRIDRPRSVAILAGFQFLQSLILLIFGVFAISSSGWSMGPWEFSLDFLVTSLVQVVTSGVGLLVLGLLSTAMALQLFRMTRYAWLFAMSLQGVILFTSLIAYLRQQPNYLLMASGVVLVFYLNQNEIQNVMRGKQDEI